MPPKYCGARKKVPGKYSGIGDLEYCTKKRQLRQYGVQHVDEEDVPQRKRKRKPVKLANIDNVMKKVEKIGKEAEVHEVKAKKYYNKVAKQVTKAKRLNDLEKRIKKLENEVDLTEGSGAYSGGTIGKSHTSYDYDELWSQLGSGASSGGARSGGAKRKPRRSAGYYHGGYTDVDIHEMDIHHGGRKRKRTAGVLIGGAKKKSTNPWMKFLAAYRVKHKSDYVGEPKKLVEDAGVHYRKLHKK